MIEVLKDILYSRHAKEIITVYGKDMILAIINDEDILIQTEKSDVKSALSNILHTKMIEECQDFSEVFEEIAKVIACDRNGTDDHIAPGTVRISVELLVSVLSRMEYEKRGRCVKNSFSRNGIIVNSFLFDVLNYFEGYHVTNKS